MAAACGNDPRCDRTRCLGHSRAERNCTQHHIARSHLTVRNRFVTPRGACRRRALFLGRDDPDGEVGPPAGRKVPDHAARLLRQVTLAGVTAVSLAKRGFTGASAIALEGEASHAAALDAASELRLRHGFRPQQIVCTQTSIRSTRPRGPSAGCPTLQGPYSLTFVVATMMVREHVGPIAMAGSLLQSAQPLGGLTEGRAR